MNHNITHPSEAQVVQYLNQRLTEFLRRYFQSKGKEYAIGPSVLRCNAFYGKIVFDVFFNHEPTQAQFAGMGFHESDEKVYEGAVEHYARWKKLGTLSSVFAYCHAMKRLIELLLQRAGVDKNEESPDYRNEVLGIHNELKRMRAGK